MKYSFSEIIKIDKSGIYFSNKEFNMRFPTKPKIIISVIIILLLTVTIIFERPFLCVFNKSEHLNYKPENIDYIEILFANGNSKENEWIEIKNKNDIEQITNHINSLNLIEVKKRESIYDPSAEYITIYIYGNRSTPVFCDDYAISVSDGYLHSSKGDECDCCYTEYYIKSSHTRFNKKDATRAFLEKFTENKKS